MKSITISTYDHYLTRMLLHALTETSDKETPTLLQKGRPVDILTYWDIATNQMLIEMANERFTLYEVAYPEKGAELFPGPNTKIMDNLSIENYQDFWHIQSTTAFNKAIPLTYLEKPKPTTISKANFFAGLMVEGSQQYHQYRTLRYGTDPTVYQYTDLIMTYARKVFSGEGPASYTVNSLVTL
ncbi:MAG: hypothetical protein LKF36_02715 [Lactobacillus sp.]|jgi:hypothetical protein|nr:hypothetical protein [Lactobacillus sp.]